jgi:hypothetical protein
VGIEDCVLAAKLIMGQQLIGVDHPKAWFGSSTRIDYEMMQFGCLVLILCSNLR